MDILLYLLELIRIRKEIGINGLGTIYKKKSPGRYDAEKHMFMPPSYTLAFTNVLKESNYLSQYIVQKRNISLSSANYFIDEFVEDLKGRIASGKHYELKNLGTFSLVNDEIQFTAAKDINFGFDFYGLPPIEEVIKNGNLDLPEEENQTEIHQEENNNLVEEPQTEVEQDEVVDSVEQEENTQLNNIVEEVKQEEHNPGDDLNTDEIAEVEEVKNVVEEDKLENTDEVYEEIAEVNSQIVHQPTNSENDQWNFEGDNVADLNSADQEAEKQFSSPEQKINEVSESAIDVAENTIAPQVENIVDTSPAVKNWEFEDKNSANDEETSTDFENETVNGEEKKSIPLYLKFLITVLVVLVIGAAAYFVNPNIFSAFVKNDNDPDQKIAMPIAEGSNLKTQTDSLSFADSITINAQKAGLQVDSAKDTLKVTTEAKPINAPTYEVIAAAFKTQREVNKYIETMKKKGIVAKEIPTAPGKLMKKISLATYNNADSAKKNLEKLKKQLKRPELYIFVNKPK